MNYYNVPFFSNTPDNTHCFQAALKMVLKYFLPEKDFSWEELEIGTAKVEGKWTWTMAGLLWMKDKGFEVKNIEVFDYAKLGSEGEAYLKEFYGEEIAGIQINNSEMNQEIEFAKSFALSEKRVPTTGDIRKLLDAGYLVICNVNARILNAKDGYSGHFVVVVGYGDRDLVLNDPGLPGEANRAVSHAVFEQAWAYPDESAKNVMAFRLS